MQTEFPAADPPQRLIDEFAATFNEQPDFIVRAPECLELLGAPSTYNDGWVLTAAATRYVWLAVKAMPAALVSVRAIDLDEEIAFRLTDLDGKSSLTGGRLPDWALYPAGVAWGLQEAGLATPGTQIAMLGDAGLSSMAGAIASAYAIGWLHITGWQIEKSRLAQLCQQALEEYAGVEGRLSDLLPAFIAKAEQVLLFDTRVMTWKSIPFPDHVALVLAESDLPGKRQTIDEEAYSIEEDARIHTAADALVAGDMETFGRQMAASQRDYAEFITEPLALDPLWAIAQGQPGWLGGRASTTGTKERLIFLVKAEAAEDFCSTTAQQYAEVTGQQVTIRPVQLASGAQIIPLP